jgi:Tfp pilus assembly major pilin PilA
MEHQKGITLIGLVITIIIMLILTGVGIKIGYDAGEKTKIENIKLNMATLRTKAKIIADKNSYDSDTNKLVGVPIAEQEGYIISEELEKILQEQESGQSKYKKCYIWEAEDFEEQGINTISINKTKFYIIDYDTCEVFYSIGHEGMYKLSDINNVKY